ncbi:MAG: type I-MYXAN CRISPR-associated endonuclease Cas1 [Planctomycetaceae bacterium]|nr:type I-MYXAN CRISPR-associated endonuclease Cas1 [Planctomycetaceae bacterium]
MVPGSSSPKSTAVSEVSAAVNAGDRNNSPLSHESPAGEDLSGGEPQIRIEALHAMKYCERLFYFQEVEQILVAHPDVYAGRRLHDGVVPEEDITPEKRSFQVESEPWGLVGKADAVRKRDGQWIVYEHKKGRCRRDADNSPAPWPSDRIQAIAYAVLISETLAEPVPEARIRYHKDNVTARVVVDDQARSDLKQAVDRARELRRSDQRPPVTGNERLCSTCSVAPVCLPEEERSKPAQMQLFPARRSGETLHVVSPKARIGRSSNTIVVTVEDDIRKLPVEDIDSVVIHGSGQMTTQALHLCSSRGIPVQWYSMGGRFMAGTQSISGRVRQRIRQFRALSDPAFCTNLARVTIQAKMESQLRYLLRATRTSTERRSDSQGHIDRIRQCLARLPQAASLDSIRGLEGQAAKSYFAAMPTLILNHATECLIPKGRTKHPPKDRFNCLLSYGYALLFGLIHRSLIAVGLEPAFGYFHQPRTAAPPLVLDVMELFRTAIWDMPLVGSVNRAMWNDSSLFCVSPGRIWLSDAGKKQAIALFESRLCETFKHPHTGTSVEYARIVELECRLLEKEWSGYPGEFGQMRLR